MRLRLLLLGLILGLTIPAWAQASLDVTKLMADTKTFIFDNNKNTVKGYIYAELEEKTACCGQDRIYLEVKIDPSGYVTKVSALTGKNDCFKLSAADIVKNVKWNTEGFRGSKSVYFEIKPDVECEEGKNNEYAALPIFNNEVLGTSGAVATAEPATPTPLPTTPTGPTRSDDGAAGTDTGMDASKPAATDVVASAPATTPPPVIKKDPPKTSADAADVVVKAPAAGEGRPLYKDPPATDAELEEARRRADAERAAQLAEIKKLKEQMQELREEEERRRESRMAAIREEEDRQRRAAAAEEEAFATARDDSRGSSPAEESGSGGGLFLDEIDEGSSGGGEETPIDPSLGEDERLRAQLDRLAQQKRDMETKMREREEQFRRFMDEQQRESEDLLRLEEQIAQVEEDAAQAREQRDLDQMEQDSRRIQDERSREEEAFQRLQDEIKRLQDESAQKIADLETKKRDLERMEELRKAREQEIILERALREQNRQKMLADRAIELRNNGSFVASGAAPAASSTLDSDLEALIPDLTAEVDSETVRLLISNISQLNNELIMLRARIQELEGGGAGAPTSIRSLPASSTSTKSGGTTSSTSSVRRSTTGTVIGGGKGTSAAKDKSWGDIDIFAPEVDESEYVIPGAAPAANPASPDAGTAVNSTPATPATVPSYSKGSGYRPHPSHKDTHVNTSGPKFGPRNYVEGDSKMKEFIRDQLKAGGICGVGQAAVSLTLSPGGDVVKYNVLAANSTAVAAQMNLVLPKLKFNAIDSRYNQTIYLDFKAEIICEGVEKDVRLKDVESFIKTDK